MEQEQGQTSDKLRYCWLDPDKLQLVSATKLLDALVRGYGCLTPKQFAEALQTGDLRVIFFSNNCAALVSLGHAADGKVMNIQTVAGDIDSCSDAIPILEQAARDIGANVITSVGYAGWARVMRKHGYIIQPRLFMRKVLT